MPRTRCGSCTRRRGERCRCCCTGCTGPLRAPEMREAREAQCWGFLLAMLGMLGQGTSASQSLPPRLRRAGLSARAGAARPGSPSLAHGPAPHSTPHPPTPTPFRPAAAGRPSRSRSTLASACSARWRSWRTRSARRRRARRGSRCRKTWRVRRRRCLAHLHPRLECGGLGGACLLHRRRARQAAPSPLPLPLRPAPRGPRPLSAPLLCLPPRARRRPCRVHGGGAGGARGAGRGRAAPRGAALVPQLSCEPPCLAYAAGGIGLAGLRAANRCGWRGVGLPPQLPREPFLCRLLAGGVGCCGVGVGLAGGEGGRALWESGVLLRRTFPRPLPACASWAYPKLRWLSEAGAGRLTPHAPPHDTQTIAAPRHRRS